ncbi:hypothetical protein DPEC_G00220850 [Dallia pectoralis]|uniref:Uncharacterized protein n=1 Tax=Dallia pectoralis TaxID=75939 RepID=A0ACC2G418_DALPE|nr:hypothetical protein DPEC_G00220850 [Dallia pectoralis]
MDPPPAYHLQSVPKQGKNYIRLQEPQEPTFQTSVVVEQPHRVAPLPRDHLLWSLFTFIYCNTFCLGLVALYYSIKSRDRKVLGDLEGARGDGNTARSVNIGTLTLTLTLCLIVIIITFT